MLSPSKVASPHLPLAGVRCFECFPLPICLVRHRKARAHIISSFPTHISVKSRTPYFSFLFFSFSEIAIIFLRIAVLIWTCRHTHATPSPAPLGLTPQGTPRWWSRTDTDPEKWSWNRDYFSQNCRSNMNGSHSCHTVTRAPGFDPTGDPSVVVPNVVGVAVSTLTIGVSPHPGLYGKVSKTPRRRGGGPPLGFLRDRGLGDLPCSRRG